VQAQSDEIEVTADKKLAFTSANSHIQAQAKDHITLTSGGAFIKLQGGNIEIHMPGLLSIKGSDIVLVGPGRMSPSFPLMPMIEGVEGDQHFVLKSHEGKPIANRKYRMWSARETIEGRTNDQGKTEVLAGYVNEGVRFELIIENFDEHFILQDEFGRPMSNMKYRITSKLGQVTSGVTDQNGKTDLLLTEEIEDINLFYLPQEFQPDQGAG